MVCSLRGGLWKSWGGYTVSTVDWCESIRLMKFGPFWERIQPLIKKGKVLQGNPKIIVKECKKKEKKSHCDFLVALYTHTHSHKKEEKKRIPSFQPLPKTIAKFKLNKQFKKDEKKKELRKNKIELNEGDNNTSLKNVHSI